MATAPVARGNRDLPPIEELILQRGEMLLLDRLLECGEEYVVVCARMLPAQHPLMDPERGLPAWVGIELMAQAVAVYAGLDHHERGIPPRIGLLLGARSYDPRVAFIAPGSRLVVRAELLWRDTSGLGVFACELRDENDVLATAQVKGYVPEDIRVHLGANIDG